MKKANIVLDEQSTGLTIIERMDFERIDAFFDVLHDTFHPNESPDEFDVRFISFWKLFLVSVGWTENEFWDEWDKRPHTCKDCGAHMDEDGNHVDDVSNPQTPPESKPN
jgi:hypothetical protein